MNLVAEHTDELCAPRVRYCPEYLQFVKKPAMRKLFSRLSSIGDKADREKSVRLSPELILTRLAYGGWTPLLLLAAIRLHPELELTYALVHDGVYDGAHCTCNMKGNDESSMSSDDDSGMSSDDDDSRSMSSDDDRRPLCPHTCTYEPYIGHEGDKMGAKLYFEGHGVSAVVRFSRVKVGESRQETTIVLFGEGVRDGRQFRTIAFKLGGEPAIFKALRVLQRDQRPGDPTPTFFDIKGTGGGRPIHDAGCSVTTVGKIHLSKYLDDNGLIYQELYRSAVLKPTAERNA